MKHNVFRKMVADASSAGRGEKMNNLFVRSMNETETMF